MDFGSLTAKNQQTFAELNGKVSESIIKQKEQNLNTELFAFEIR